MANEVSLTPNDAIFFCGLLSHPKKTGLSTWRRGHRWQRTNGDVSQVFLKNRGLVLAVASRGDKFCTVAANYGQTVVAVDSWSFQRATSPQQLGVCP